MHQEFHERLKEIARADQGLNLVDQLEHQRALLYRASGLEELDAAIISLKNRPANLRAQLRVDVEEYVHETDDNKPHDLLTVRRGKKPVYDTDEAISWCELNAPRFLVMQPHLEKKNFNAACLRGDVEWDALEIVDTMIIAIPSSLEHLLVEVGNV